VISYKIPIAILFATILVISATSFPPSYSEIQKGTEIECREGQVLVYRTISNNYVCTSENAAKKWVQYGFAEIVKPATDTTKQEEMGPIVGGDRDEHGCVGSAGYLWSEKMQQCLRPWENPEAFEDLSEAGIETQVEDELHLLFALTAGSGSLTPASGAVDTTHKLMLNDKTDPPNVALEVMVGEEGVTIIAELRNPEYDSESNTISFDANVLSEDVPEEFGAVGMVIDSLADELKEEARKVIHEQETKKVLSN
jgi:hypothetical protein